MNSDKFKQVVHAVIEDFSNEKPALLLQEKSGVCERAICFRLGLLLAKRVEPEFIVDSEYNIDLSAGDPKSLPDTGKTGRVFPDLIVHKRTADRAENFAVIEVKFLGDDDGLADARVRVNKFLKKYGYSVGVVISIPRSQVNFIKTCEVEFILPL